MSSTTWSTRSAPKTSRSRIARQRRRSRAKRPTQACVRSSTSAGSAPTAPACRRICAAGARRGGGSFETILGLVKRLPFMVTPSWVSTPTQPIALADVAHYLAGVCGNEAPYGEGYAGGGPEVMTYRQMIERIAALLGRKPRIVEVPVLTPYLSSLWLNLVTPVSASVARPLVEGLRNPTIAREERIRTLLPLELTPFDEAARRALA